MTFYEQVSVLIASAALIVSIVAIVVSFRSASETNKINVRIAQRQNVVNLQTTWRDTSMLAEPVVIPDLVKAVNALSETAAAWNHDINDRRIIDQMYYDSFSRLYDFIESKREELIPSLSKTYRSLLSPDIQRAYQEMKQFHLSHVPQSKIL